QPGSATGLSAGACSLRIALGKFLGMTESDYKIASKHRLEPLERQGLRIQRGILEPAPLVRRCVARVDHGHVQHSAAPHLNDAQRADDVARVPRRPPLAVDLARNRRTVLRQQAVVVAAGAGLGLLRLPFGLGGRFTFSGLARFLFGALLGFALLALAALLFLTALLFF